jgi:heme oxygenase
MAYPRSLSTSDGRREGAWPLHQELRRETADLHRRLEIDLGLLESDLSLDRYRRVLEFFFGFYAPVEADLARVASAGPPLGLPLRARTALIQSDLLSLGRSRREITDLPRCGDLPRLSRPEELAGCLYVLEGACLGGQVIASALRERLGVAKGSGASFFIGDGEGTPARWRLFLTWLEGLAGVSSATAEIVGSARATFLAFARWVEQQRESHRQCVTADGRHGGRD